MKVLVTGEQRSIDELKENLPADSAVATSLEEADLQQVEAVFDLDFDKDPVHLERWAACKDLPVFAGAARRQLAESIGGFQGDIACKFFGMNSLPTFINRDLMELSLYDNSHADLLDEVASKLGWQYRLVEDRVGMVTPRIIFMIINEACYTLQESTASKEDIDNAMKLGTNYPYGPFEWADRIGIEDIYETLLAIYQDTHDERYKSCPLLKTKYLRKESFY